MVDAARLTVLIDLQRRIVEALQLADDNALIDVAIRLDEARMRIAAALLEAGRGDEITPAPPFDV